MTVRLVREYEAAGIETRVWELNGAMQVSADVIGDLHRLGISAVRRREWKDRAASLLEDAARSKGVLLRVEKTIDGDLVLVHGDAVASVLETVAGQRLGS